MLADVQAIASVQMASWQTAFLQLADNWLGATSVVARRRLWQEIFAKGQSKLDVVLNDGSVVAAFYFHRFNSMNANHVLKLGQASLSGSLPFPEIVGCLIAEGVEYYHVDYAALHLRFYSSEGAVVMVPLSFENVPQVAPDFDASALKAAIVDSQKHGQKFKDFARRAAEAGVAGYFVFLRGKHVTYYGRQGAHHVEWFPGAKPVEAWHFVEAGYQR